MVAFSALTKTGAEGFARVLLQNPDVFPAITLHGEWQKRRLVIRTLSQSPPVAGAVPDYEALTLTLPLVEDPEYYVHECARFGAAAASRYRAREAGRFESEIGIDGRAHLVHAFHHVALCGYRKWPLHDSVVSSPRCEHCAAVAATMPKHRARFHPLLVPRQL
jgi:hypothetical protein